MRHHLSSSAVAAILSIAIVGAQTRITPPANKYSPADDVKLGREAAAEARREMPIMRDELVTSYVQELGQRIVSGIPTELRHNEFRYTFETVNVRDINAFALPGGPMFVNRGMIEAAANEGEVAGVMAHEISHVALRHGTAQASQASKPLPQVVGIAGAIAGAILGGTRGQIVSGATQFGLGLKFLQYGREYERQADLQGAQIMARAGYDPRDMASMFKTIEKQGGAGGPEWMSSHPNPGNRYEAINQEAQSLPVSNPVRRSQAFDNVKAHLRTLPKAPTTEEVTRSTSRSPGSGGGSETGDVRPSGRVVAPSSRYVTYNEGDRFRVSVPSNWRELPANDSVTFAPEGAYGRYQGQNVFTHGIQLGFSRNERHDLQTATDEMVDALRESNPNLSRPSSYRRGTWEGRPALRTTLENTSDITGNREFIHLTTTQTIDGNLFYAIGVAPSGEFSAYEPVFTRIVDSIKVTAR